MQRNSRATWVEGFHFKARSHSGKEIRLDSWKEREREETGPTPAELIPMALGTCTGMDIIMILEKMRLNVTALEVDVQAEALDDDPRTFTDFQITYHLRGEDLDTDKVERAIVLSRDKYCLISITLEKAASLSHFYTINGGEPRKVLRPDI